MLATSAGETIQVFHPGIRNDHAGPDFSDAKIQIENLEWRGSVEIHIKASGWNDHHHSTDQTYEKVVLHVVWENDKPVQRTDGSVMPTLELKGRVDPKLWNRYKKLFTSSESIPCANRWPAVPALTKISMLDRTVVHRLQSKARLVKDILLENNNDWEETTYQLIGKNFGFKVNAEPMLHLMQVLPYKILLKHPTQIEALLFGQAGFLEKTKNDEYTSVLTREYHLLSKKYDLSARQMNQVQWRFLRLRPANFPTIRLAQLATLLGSQLNLFSKILESSSYKSLVVLFDVDQSEYWKNHYRSGVRSPAPVPSIGKSSIQNIIINTIAPLFAAYSQVHDDDVYMNRAVQLLQDIPAEKNKITREWSSLGFALTSAFDSQGLIGLYNDFCMRRRCLDCAVGTYLIKS